MAPKAHRTYGSRITRTSLPSSPPSSPPTLKRKRPLIEQLSFQNTPPAKKTHLSLKSSATSSTTKLQKKTGKEKQKQLTQLHFSLDTSVLRTCPLCDLTYTKGAPDDEILHRAHCARVQRGLEWGKEEERESGKAGVEEIASEMKLKNGAKGRIICFRAEVGGKIGSKLSTLLETINLTLSSPALSSTVLQASKVYLFLLKSPLSSSSSHREKIVGCVIAQRISTAMAIASESANATSAEGNSSSRVSLIPVDAATNLYVNPTPLPTPLGIPRLFVSSSHRRLGIATRLLTAAAETFILGCPLDPTNGDVAFTQPTGAGKGVLEKWGKGGIRIYEE